MQMPKLSMDKLTKTRMKGLLFWALIMSALAASIAWPSAGLDNVAVLAMVAMNLLQGTMVLAFGVMLSYCKHEDADKRSKALASVGDIVATRKRRTAFWRAVGVVQCVSLAVLAAYVGMLLAAVLYAFFAMVIRLQYAAAIELIENPADASQAPSTNQANAGQPGPSAI